MSKGRAVMKYGTTGVVTALYGLALVRAKTHPKEQTEYKYVVAAASILVGATWLIAAL